MCEQTKNSASTHENQGTSPANKKKARTSKQEVEKVPSSDAILSCPACMTTLCIDCQRLVLNKLFWPLMSEDKILSSDVTLKQQYKTR